MGTKRKRRDDGWIPLADMHRVFGVSSQSFDRYVRSHFPPDAMRKDGRSVVFYARDCIEAWAVKKFIAPVDGDDSMLATGTSPALERYRLARARQAELDLAEREGSLVRVDQLDAAWVTISGILRRAGATLQRQHGSGARDILDAALDAADEAMKSGPETQNAE
jgi:phage terminase Nu1 subunit (DNA packaging protein)